MKQIEKEELYPMLFEPLYQEAFWGGQKLRTSLGRPIPVDRVPPIGEAWDVLDQPNVSSPVANGVLAGATLHELVSHFGRDFVGSNFTGEFFPLTFRLIDAGKRQALSVHPGVIAARSIPGAEPCTKMWYVLAADRGAKIYAGVKAATTKQRFLDLIASQDLEKLLQCFDAVPGDAYFLNAGRVHCIGSGNLILEIGQNSRTEYRINDWGRLGSDGLPRTLQVREALASIDFMDRTVSRVCGASNRVLHNRKYPIINRCPYFQTDDLRLAEDWRDTTNPGKTCHLLTAINRAFDVVCSSGRVRVEPGVTVLIPACLGSYLLSVQPNETTTVIKTIIL